MVRRPQERRYEDTYDSSSVSGDINPHSSSFLDEASNIFLTAYAYLRSTGSLVDPFDGPHHIVMIERSLD
jgi:hypothetical protein